MNKCLLCNKPSTQRVLLLDANKCQTHNEYLRGLKQDCSNNYYHYIGFCEKHRVLPHQLGKNERII